MQRLHAQPVSRTAGLTKLALGLLLGVACAMNCAASIAAPANLVKNADLSVLEAGKPQGWAGFEGGFELAAGAGREGRNAALLQRTAAADTARGISQNVVIEQKTIAPLTVAAWSKAENVSGTADNDYSVYADLTFQDGTNQWGLFAAAAAGTHDWQKSEFKIAAEKPIKSLTVYGLFRNHTGKAWFGDFSITGEGEAAAAVSNKRPNLLINPLFADLQVGKPLNWNAFQGGFETAVAGGRDGVNAVVMQRGANDEGRGIGQNVVLDQKTAGPIIVSGWSKAENVSGTIDNNYCLYADVLYNDGTNSWGVNTPFETGTHDWQYAEITFKPEKPVKSLTFYALLREHTGKAWFSNLSVSAEDAAAPAPKTQPANIKQAKVEAEKPFVSQPYRAVIAPEGALMKLADGEQTNMLQNPAFTATNNGLAKAWEPWGQGYTLQANGGRNGGAAVYIERSTKDGERGILQELVLNQRVAAPLRLTGWSRAEGVDGAPDSDYSLYSDVLYTDDTSLWGLAGEFRTGTHGWEKAEVFIEPAKPIKSLKIYALFRGHTGKAWFSDISLSSIEAPNGAALFDTLAVRLPKILSPLSVISPPHTYKTADGLSLQMLRGYGWISSLQLDGKELAAANTPSGFMARDVANDTGFYGFESGEGYQLKLGLETKIESADNYIAFSGKLSDKTGKDRAISLAFALPIDARGWNWNKDIRSIAPITNGEYSNTASFFAGANGRQSVYPLGNISGADGGLAIAIDMNQAAQYRIAYNAATKQFYIVYDFGLAPEKNSADFRFVLYRTDPKWGFRSATAKLYQIFPKLFEVREAAKKQGLWMPFTDISKVQNWQDFGFRFREAEAASTLDSSLAFDDKNGFLTFRYSEPMTWWMAMPASVPRTYENAIAQLQQIASDPSDKLYPNAQAVLSSGFRDESGRYAVKFLDTPWANGAVWSLNTSPNLQGMSTGASLLWSDAIKSQYYDNNPAGQVDGEYLDSLEGYVTANLNFDRSQWSKVSTPLTFSSGSKAPAQHKAFSAYEFSRWMSSRLHAMNKLTMANSVPYRFSFLTPWFDVMGTEADWNPDGKWHPDDDSLMNLRRTMSGAKPYLLLQNTVYKNFSAQLVEKYMQRSLFYGIFPGFFSHDAASDPYWLNPAMYNRDRNLFKKYIPVIQQVAEAGWQPVTLATSDRKDVWLERFGTQYLTLRNDNALALGSAVTLSGSLAQFKTATDLISGVKYPIKNGVFTLNLAADQTVALRLS